MTRDDIAAANRLAHDVLGRSLDDLPPQTRRLLGLIVRLVAERCAAAKMEREDCRFTRRQVREFTGWSDSQLKTHLSRLEEMEYLLAHRGGRGQSFIYELAYDGGGADGGRFLTGLLDVTKLHAGTPTMEGKSGLDEKKSGLKGEKSGPSLPEVGTSLGAKNAPLSSEKPSKDPKLGENAHQDSAGDDAAA